MTRTAPLAPFPILDDAELGGKRVLIRVDLNVPMDGGTITDATRIDRILPNLQEIAAKGARSHHSFASRPPEKAVRRNIRCVRSSPNWQARLGKPVAFAEDCIGDETAKAGRGAA